VAVLQEGRKFPRFVHRGLLGPVLLVQGFGVEILREQGQEVLFGIGSGEHGEDMLEVEVRVESVGLCGGDERKEGCSGFGTLWGAREEPVLPPHGKDSDDVFHCVIVRAQPAVLQEDQGTFPLAQGIVNGFAQAGFRGRNLDPLVE
jgi:hypothetical protein